MLIYWKGHIFINFNLQESEIPTLQGLSFTVRPGELLAVVGPVGAGKVSCDAFHQFDAMLQLLLNSQSGAQSWVWLSLSLNWVYLERCFSRNISFAKRFHGKIHRDKCTLCFPSWCFMLYSWKQLVGNLDSSLKEIIYVTAVQDGQRHGDFLFITVAPPWSLQVAKALPGSSEHFLTWRLGPVSVHVVNVQPCAGDKGTEVSKTLTLCLSEAIRLWGETDMQSYYFSPVSWALWWCGYTHATSVWCWRLKVKLHIHLVWNNKIQKPNVGCGLPWWLSGRIIPC